MKTFRRHNCSRAHRDLGTATKCIWKRAAWIAFDGIPSTSKGPAFALIAYCRVTTVTIWERLEKAEAAKKLIDDMACGGKCYGAAKHEIVQLVSVDEMEEW